MSDDANLTLAYLELAPHAAAEVLQGLPVDEAAAYLETVPVRLAAPAMACMKPWGAARCLESLSRPRAAATLRRLPFHESVSLIRLIEPLARRAVLEELPSGLAGRFERALQYLPNQVGAWADSQVPVLRTHETVRDALRAVQSGASSFSHVFLESKEEGRFVGILSVRALLNADPAMPLSELSIHKLDPVSNRQSLQAIAGLPLWDELLHLPVVGRRGNVLGGLSRSALRQGLIEYSDHSWRPARTMLGQLLSAFFAAYAGMLRLAASEHSTATPQDENGSHVG